MLVVVDGSSSTWGLVALPVPAEATPAYLSFVMLGHTVARATLVARASA